MPSPSNIKSALVCLVCLVLFGASPCFAQAANGLGPGDPGRPNGGLPFDPSRPLPPPPLRPNEARAASLPLGLAIKLAEAASSACAGFHVSVSVLDASGAPKLTYVTDGAVGPLAYFGFRKAYTALTFGSVTSRVGERALTDPKVAERIRNDPWTIAWAGGTPIRAKGVLVGALGVSGAEPSAKDEACAMAALAALGFDAP